MSKKRKTPSAPRSPFEETSRVRSARAKSDHGAVTMIGMEHDTDEEHLGDVLPGYDDFMDGATRSDLPAIGADDELLDLRGLDGLSRASIGDGSHFEELKVEVSPDLLDEGAAPVDEQRRLTSTLLRIFARRRQQIRLSLDQLARLSGISLQVLHDFESSRPKQSITYDQTVVLARVLGVATDELPGLRRREARSHLGVVLAELERTMLAAPLLRFEGKHGERFGGDVERAAASKSFTVRIEDDSLEPTLTRGMVLGFMSGVRPRLHCILLLRHRRSALLAIRRYEPPAYSGLAPWQPSYVVGGEWHLIGALEVLLPPR